MEASILNALLGGLIIGLAATMLFSLAGRIAGISGIVTAAIKPGIERGWRWLFLLGLLLGGFAYHAISGAAAPELARDNYWLAIAGGLIVGMGVRRGSGCTSGHSVCGIAQFSKRSIVSTIIFMAVGIATATTLNILLGTFQ